MIPLVLGFTLLVCGILTVGVVWAQSQNKTEQALLFFGMYFIVLGLAVLASFSN